MKQKNILKTLSLFLVVVVSALATASCSSDDEEPDFFGTGTVNVRSMIPYSEIYGTWIIEGIKDSESGVVTPINQKITIADFTPIIDSLPVRAEDYDLWGYEYSDILSYDDQNLDDDKSVIILINFCKKNQQSLDSSLISTLYFGAKINSNISSLTQSFFLSSFKFSDGLLQCSNSVYEYKAEGKLKSINGVVSMRKL